ncbi:MAG TPA: hypothetical protein VHA12_02770 [Candidatus Nanoarchaeia archaeon]|nr:hypothetical protein [Candidatus Nanoarchaeia archaeon]
MAKEINYMQGWRLIFYILGWATGVFSLLFWAIQIVCFFAFKEKKFFSGRFHMIVFWYGLIAVIAFVLGFIFAALGVLLLKAMMPGF